MKCLVLASGFGTRLLQFGVSQAKGLIEYQGQPLITHIVNKVPSSIDILVNTNMKFADDFRSWQRTLGRSVTLCVEPVFEVGQSMGAVGSLDHWIRAKSIDDDLLVIASDNYFEFDLGKFISAYDGKNALVALHDVGDRNRASQFGVVQVDGGRITAFDEKPPNPKSSLVSTGIYIFPKRVFQVLRDFCVPGRRDNLGSLVAHLVAEDEVHAYCFDELWLDVGSVETYLELQRMDEAAHPGLSEQDGSGRAEG